MNTLQLLLSLATGFGLLYVWLIRFGKPSPYRGGRARDMVEEFSEYGLPKSLVWIVGAAKVTAAIALILSLVVPWLLLPSIVVIAFLMLAAISLHVKINDQLRKSLPAATLLVMTLLIAASSLLATAS